VLKKQNTLENFKVSSETKTRNSNKDLKIINKLHDQFQTEPTPPRSKVGRRGSHKVEDIFYFGLNDTKVDIKNAGKMSMTGGFTHNDNQISQLKLMRLMANNDLKMILEKKNSEKKSSKPEEKTSSEVSPKHMSNPFLLAVNSEKKFIFSDEDNEEDRKTNVI
jgi:hypothetical protein